ncbi:ROK family transcriptional regulator [Olivibacter sitiensis]|uniref:ROK family transcriptional regulator n=1 Tax=Olivibacter sitiensis TaxID=376470 RepID=UPI00041FD105|nr:ROK family transcriptional regulator [Olivibacter sitiensis]
MSEQVLGKKRSSQLFKNEIVKLLYYEGEMSCADLGKALERSIPTVNTALLELIADGIVVEFGFAPSKGGRRPVLYALKAQGKYILSVAMDQLVTKVAIIDLKNNFVGDISVFDLPLLHNEQALSILIERVNAHLDASGISRTEFIGAGIGVPGFVDMVDGLNYTYLSDGNINLREYISKAIEIPTFIDNDSSLIALAELRFGIAKEKEDVMVINIGWGIGLGMIVNGKIFRGHNGLAGEFSHIPLYEDGKLCSCGKQGCLEAEASLLVVANKVAEGIKEQKVTSLSSISPDNITKVGEALMEEANKGDQFAVQLLSDAAYQIGKAISILIHIMNPEAIVLSGRGAKVGKILLAPIQQALNKFCIPRLAANMDLSVSNIGYNAELYGAAALVMDHYNNEQ